jgi:amidase
MEYRTARELAAALRARKLSSAELVEQTIRTIERDDGGINAVVVRDFDRARIAARHADALLMKGSEQPLLGVPMTVKEAFHVAGLPTTWGLPGTEKIPVTEDATVVARLKTAGAIIVGKTNVATMLADWQSMNPVYGATNNPYDVARTCGGSSGGGAAALAAGFVPVEYGSDLASSLRAPAHFCGIYAHKPSYGIVPQRGFAPPGAPADGPTIDMSVLGPMARSAGDLALALEATAGADAREATGWRLALSPPRHAVLKEHRVLVLDSHPLIPTSEEIVLAIAKRVQALERAGCKIGHADPNLPDLRAIAALFVERLMALFSANTSDAEFSRARAAADALPKDADPMASAVIRGHALSHRDWLLAGRARFALAQQWRKLFESWDIVLCPSMPLNAYRHIAPSDRSRPLDVDGNPLPYEAQALWGTLATLAGNPATAAPIGLSRDGLPVGVQLIGPLYEDRTTINFAELMEREFGGFIPPKGR